MVYSRNVRFNDEARIYPRLVGSKQGKYRKKIVFFGGNTLFIVSLKPLMNRIVH